MKLAAIMPVRNEDWVLGFSARAALRWCDLLVCLNHASTDRSRAILEELATEYPGRVLIVDHEDPEWREMEHRQWLLTIARQYDATHIALVDADEVLCGDSLPHVRAQIERLPAGRCVNVRMYCMWRGIQQYRTDPGSVWSNRRDLALAFCDAPRLAWAAAEDGYQHHARAPQHSRPVHADDLGVMHLQFADWRRLKAKHALYKVRERLAYPQRPVALIESMYNQALNEVNIEVKTTPWPWLEPYRDIVQHLNMKRVPWQEAEVQRIVRQHGAGMFAGLTLFGVDRQETR